MQATIRAAEKKTRLNTDHTALSYDTCGSEILDAP
jgi:hypothetical protein